MRIGNLERLLEKEVDKRERSDKYTHNLIEDVQHRYAEMATNIAEIKVSFLKHLEDDKMMSSNLKVIERLVWVAVGGICILGAGIGIAVTVILHYLK
jgi:fatty-acid desaturase